MGDAIGCVRSRRQCLIEHSSRKTMGRPVPKLILFHNDQVVKNSPGKNLLMIEPVETQPDSRRYN